MLDLIAGNEIEIEFLFKQPYERLQEIQRSNSSQRFPHVEGLLLSILGFHTLLENKRKQVSPGASLWMSNFIITE